jgi:hypothetical protein
MTRLEEGWAEGLTTAQTADLLARTAMACRSSGREDDDGESLMGDVETPGAVDLYRFRTPRGESVMGGHGRGSMMTYHTSVGELVKSLDVDTDL